MKVKKYLSYKCTNDYGRRSTNLFIHENSICPQTTKIASTNLNDYRVCLFFSPLLVSRQNIYLLLIDFETVVNNIIYTLDKVKHCIFFPN